MHINIFLRFSFILIYGCPVSVMFAIITLFIADQDINKDLNN